MSLITHADYYDFIGALSPFDADEEDRIDTAITDAEKFIMERISRTILVCGLSPVQTIEKFSGKGQTIYWTKQAPIAAFSKAEFWDGTQWVDVVTDYGYTLAHDDDTGQLWFEEGYVFDKGRNNWRVTYTHGYTDLPADLRRALCILVKHFLIQSERQGIKQQSDGEQNFSYDNEIPSLALDIINRYIRYR